MSQAYKIYLVAVIQSKLDWFFLKNERNKLWRSEPKRNQEINNQRKITEEDKKKQTNKKVGKKIGTVYETD